MDISNSCIIEKIRGMGYAIPSVLPWIEWRHYGERPWEEVKPWYENPDILEAMRRRGINPDDFIFN